MLLIAESFPKLSKVNSLAVGGILFYVKKEGVIYHCYDYKSKVLVTVSETKERLTIWLNKNIEEVKRRLSERS